MADRGTSTFGYFRGSEVCHDGVSLEVRSCYTDEPLARTFRPPAASIEQAVERTLSAARAMRTLSSFERAEILRNMSKSLEESSPEFVRMLALEAGKPVKAGRVEVERCVFNLRNASEEAQRLESEMISLDLFPAARGRWGLIRRFPVGTILAITPFNFPLNLVAHKVAPAIASGNSIVQKPASKTPICSLMLARIAYASGLPEDALSVLPCSGREAGELASSDRFGLVTFTGSAEVGWGLKRKVKRSRVTLELGGNAGVIVHSDADLEDAAARCAVGGFSYAGQSCISVQRIFVQKAVFDRFLQIFVDKVNGLKSGDPLDEGTDVGPLISPDDAGRVVEWIGEAVSGGAQLLTGGEREGSLVKPAVLTNTDETMRVNCQEVFGPVVTVEAYDDFPAALEAVNDSRFGLQAGVFTSNLDRILRAFDALDVGGVVVNDVPTFRADHMPYGGVKDSGTGREGARYAIEEMTERKILILRQES
jgi:acyl-CoA reductase-like NAD-dependent aldehyde dehydrogenase